MSRTLHFLKQKSGQLKTTTWVIKIGLVTFITFTFQFNNEIKKNNKSRNQYPKFKAICFQYCTYYVISTTFITFAKRNCCNMIFFCIQMSWYMYNSLLWSQPNLTKHHEIAITNILTAISYAINVKQQWLEHNIFLIWFQSIA